VLHLPPEEPDFSPWKVVAVPTLLESWRGKLPDPVERPGVIAVDGRSAGGKTTMAKVLSGAVPGSVVVHTDDIAWHHSFFDWVELLRDGVLVPARAGREVHYRPPAWEPRNREGAVEVPLGCPLVIVEGVGAARKELMPLVDVVVWVQSDTEQARTRGITRDGGDAAAVAFWDEWMSEEFPFLAEQRPWERADVVVAGTPDVAYDPTSEVVVAI
jgi:hypothetical protein